MAIQVTSTSGQNIKRASSNVGSAQTNEGRAKVKLGIDATPECRLAEAIQTRYPAPSSDYNARKLAEILKPNDQTSTGQFIPREYLYAFRRLEAQIEKQMKDIAERVSLKKSSPKNQPLMIKDIIWPAVSPNASQEEQKHVDQLKGFFKELILTTLNNRIGDFEFNGVKFSNCELNDFDFAQGASIAKARFSNCKLGGCKFISAEFKDSHFINDKNIIIEPSSSLFHNIKLPDNANETDPQKYFESIYKDWNDARQEYVDKLRNFE